MPRSALLSLVFGHPDAVLAGEGVLEALGVDVDRRGFGGLAAGAAAAIMLPEAVIPARVTGSHVRLLQAALDSLNIQEQSSGGATLFQSALRYWRQATRMLKESSSTDAVRRQLLGVGGDLALCAGYLACDAGDVPQARRLYSAALKLAGSAGDPVLNDAAEQALTAA
jgi:hypothetical protein